MNAHIVRLIRVAKSRQPEEQGVIYVTVNGRVGLLMPMDERVYKRLHEVSTELNNRSAPAGLNPRHAPLFKPRDKSGGVPVKNVLNFESVAKVLKVSEREARAMTASKGTTMERVRMDLAMVKRESAVI
jgi:hypothetical protein